MLQLYPKASDKNSSDPCAFSYIAASPNSQVGTDLRIIRPNQPDETPALHEQISQRLRLFFNHIYV